METRKITLARPTEAVLDEDTANTWRETIRRPHGPVYPH